MFCYVNTLETYYKSWIWQVVYNMYCRENRCNKGYWPGLNFDPRFIFQHWILIRGSFFNVENWDQKSWNSYPGSFFNRLKKLLIMSSISWKLTCLKLTPSTEIWTVHEMALRKCIRLTFSASNFNSIVRYSTDMVIKTKKYIFCN